MIHKHKSEVKKRVWIAAARLQMPPNYLTTGSGLVPLEVQPASGLAVAIGDLLLTGLVGYSTFDGKDTN